MHTFLDNFEQGRKYLAQIASHQAETRREENLQNQKSLNISSLKTGYLNLDSSSGFGRDSERAHAVQIECTFCGGIILYAEQFFKRIRMEKEKARAVDVSSNRKMEHTPWECFRCESEDHMIAKFPNQVFLMKEVIMHATTAKMIVTARYMHIWNECLATTNGKFMVILKTETEQLCKRGDIIQE